MLLLMALAIAVILVVASRDEWKVPGQQRSVNVAGIVRSIGVDDAPILLFNGSSIRIKGRQQLLQIGTFREGSFLLAGEAPDPWYVTITGHHPDGCFAISTLGRDEGTTIATGLGIRFAKAATYRNYGPSTGLLNDPLGQFCLDDTGAVIWYDKKS